jgi:hypothetical protein
MTKVTANLRKNPGQRTANDTLHAMSFFSGSSWLDCRINAFGLNQRNPDLIFIDVDPLKKKFSSRRAFELCLPKILRNIEEKIGGHPSVIQSGRGYHIIQPIECPIDLEKEMPELKALVERYENVSNEFLQFAERYLSLHKCDDSNSPALGSCLLRIPGSKNAKCEEMKIDSEVKIVQRWDGSRPSYKLLLGSFHAYLVGEKIKKEEKERERKKKHHHHHYSYSTEGALSHIPQQYRYIEEKLLKTPIDDDRKLVVGIILSRYLINTKKLEYEQAHEIIWQWLDLCTKLKPLEPRKSQFDREVVRYQLDLAQKNGRLAMTETKLQEKYPGLYSKLWTSGES